MGMMGTKILATSDLHGHLDLFRRAVDQTEPEIAIVAGDMTDMGLLDWLGLGQGPSADQWSRFCQERSQVDFIMVPGNHERLYGTPSRFHIALTRAAAEIRNLNYLDDSQVTIRGIRFGGGEFYSTKAVGNERGSVDIAVFHHRPHDATAINRRFLPNLIVYGHTHHGGNFCRSGKVLILDVSTAIKRYGCYLIDYEKRGSIEAKWVVL